MENYSYAFGVVPAEMFFAMVVFAAIGVVIRLLFDAHERDQTSKNTPVKFSFWFLVKDNWKTIALTALLVLVTLRFPTQLVPEQFSPENLDDPLGKEKWLFGALIVGIAFNHLAQRLKAKSDLLKVKRPTETDNG